MSEIDQRWLKKAKVWIQYADEDLTTAESLLELQSSIPFRIVAYHAQQTIEKYLKAYLLYHQVDFPFTHDLLYLINLCAKQGNWTTPFTKISKITDLATTARYPGRDSVSREEANEALDWAKKVKIAVLKELQGI